MYQYKKEEIQPQMREVEHFRRFNILMYHVEYDLVWCPNFEILKLCVTSM